MPQSVPLPVRHVIGRLHKDYDGIVDMSDKASAPAEQLESAFLSRALTAAALRSLTGCTVSEAAAGVIDGYDDQGIDGILVHPT